MNFDKDPHLKVSTKIVLQLMKPLLHQGRIVFTDNYYTSVTLARELLAPETYVVGTHRKKLNGKSCARYY